MLTSCKAGRFIVERNKGSWLVLSDLWFVYMVKETPHRGEVHTCCVLCVVA